MLHDTGRQVVHGREAVATSQPLAAQAGLDLLARGGNAIDAAVAAAACLTVVEPTSNGLGGDLFAIVWDGHRLHGLDASGKSPAGWTPDRFADHHHMPQYGGDSVTVPGGVSGWRDLLDRFGSKPIGDVLEPAVRYAADGFPVSPITADAWCRGERVHGHRDGFRRTFCPKPAAGEMWRAPGHAKTLQTMQRDGVTPFYVGDIARAIVEAVRDDGGVLAEADLADHENRHLTADDLLSAEACGVTLHEIPPAGQGVAAQMALLICEQVGCDDWFSPQGMHVQVEAMKLAFADLHAHVADPAAMRFPPAALLDPAYARDRANTLDQSTAGDYGPGSPRQGGTVYLAAADRQGRMVSLIQSNYYGFGSGVVTGDWGIALQNRGFGFTLEVDHPNRVGPRKRPFHTIIPGFVTRAGRPLAAFGVMGGPMQAQGHLQVVLRRYRLGQTWQQAIDAPRWQLARGVNGRWQLWHEPDLDRGTVTALSLLGHDLHEKPWLHFGGAQAIERLDNGSYAAASDPRKDGHAVAR
jgi:gamma-glutamyltranspeptidase/glutathione hydrolase